jgi:hypothetical protein
MEGFSSVEMRITLNYFGYGRYRWILDHLR